MESPIEWNIEEYVPELGCYLKWLHGDPSQQIEKLYCMAAFHFFTTDTGYIEHLEYQKYAEYMDISVNSIIVSTTDWYVRVYIDESVLNSLNPENVIWREKLAVLYTIPRVQVICVKMPRYYLPNSQNHQGLLPVIFRYLPLFDKNTSILLFRDIDNIWTEQHHYFVDKWLTNGNEDIFLFMNQNYKRQEIKDLTQNDVILDDHFYTAILSGLWSVRKPMGSKFSYSIWQKMFAYNESYTDFVNLAKYKEYKYHKVRFTYGFDELMLTRIALPLLIREGLSVYAIPIKIYDEAYLQNLFDGNAIKKFLKVLTTPDNIEIIQRIVLKNYWHMSTPNVGLSQYIICLLTNIYFNIITTKNKFYKNDIFINAVRYKVYPVPLLMGLGLFTFKNYKRYNWFNYDGSTSSGINILHKFLTTNTRLTIAELTANSDLSNDGDGTDTDPYGI
jgi:hypothetical protein